MFPKSDYINLPFIHSEKIKKMPKLLSFINPLMAMIYHSWFVYLSPFPIPIILPHFHPSFKLFQIMHPMKIIKPPSILFPLMIGYLQNQHHFLPIKPPHLILLVIHPLILLSIIFLSILTKIS